MRSSTVQNGVHPQLSGSEDPCNARDAIVNVSSSMLLIGLLVTLLVTAAQAADEYSVPRTLLLAQTLSIKDSHSRFLQYLEASGRELDVREVSDDTLRLRDWDIWLYNEVIIMSPQAEGNLPPARPPRRWRAAPLRGDRCPLQEPDH